MTELIQLSELIDRVRSEASQSLNVSHGVNNRPQIINLINRVQRDLAAGSDWDVLDTHQIKTLADSQWIYDIPNNMNFQKIRSLRPRGSDGTLYDRLKKGFGPVQFAASDPVAGDTQWPPTRWRLSTSSIHSIDIWPMPDRAGYLDIEGQIVPDRIVDDDDYCQLDADLIALRVAEQLLLKDSPVEAQAKRAAADKRLIDLRAGQSSNKEEDIVLGGGLRDQFVNHGLER